jgi:hypothetical protein
MDLLHSWSLLRLLFVFLLACPFLVLPMLLGFFKKQPAKDSGYTIAGRNIGKSTGTVFIQKTF